MLIVTGSIRTRPEHLDRVLELSLEHVYRSRQEPGCLLHSVHRDVEHENRLLFLEHWADADALRRALRGASVDRFRARGRCACRGRTRAIDLRGAAGVGVGLLCSGVSQRRLACPAARPPIGQLPNAKDCGSVRRRSFQQHPARVGACRRRRPARLYRPHAERRVGRVSSSSRLGIAGDADRQFGASCWLGGGERPRSVEDLGTWPVQANGVVPAVHDR